MVLKRGKLVGVTGPAGCGKSTARTALTDRGWYNVKMAGALKRMAKDFFIEAGLDPDRCIDGDLKEVKLDKIGGVSPRYVMQTLGTEWGRNVIGQNIWVDMARNHCERWLKNGVDVVVDDIRFDNEAEMIWDLGGVVVGITGRGGISGDHESERGVRSDLQIDNSGDVRKFENDVIYILHSHDA